MAIKNTNDLTVQMEALLANNVTQDISPQDHRDSLGDTIDSLINKLDNKPLLGAKEYNALRGITPALAYEAGELAIESGVLYQANIGILAAQAFTPANWTNLTPSQSANNGLNVSGGNVRMGGLILSPTNVTGINNTNFLTFQTTEGSVKIKETDTLDVNNIVGLGEVTPFVPRVRGISSYMEGNNDESIAIDAAVTGGSTLSIAGKFLAQLASDDGIAGFFDAANNVNHNRALVTDRGNIGFGWTDFPFGTTESLINIKNPGGVGYAYLLAGYESGGATPVHQLSIAGRGDYADGISIGVISGMGAKTDPLSVLSTGSEAIALYNTTFQKKASLYIDGGVGNNTILNTSANPFEVMADGDVTARFGSSHRVTFSDSTSPNFDGWHFYTEATGNGDRAIFAKVATGTPGGTTVGGFFENVGSSTTKWGVDAKCTGSGGTTNIGIEAAASGQVGGAPNNIAIRVQSGNGQVLLGLGEYADDTAAGSAGLVTGMLYVETTSGNRHVSSKS